MRAGTTGLALLSVFCLAAASLSAGEAGDGDCARARGILAEVLRPPLSNDLRRVRLRELFLRASLPEGWISTQAVPARRGDPESANILARIPGSAPDSATVVVGAHTDTVRGSAGAVDNWSGCVMLAALAARLAGSPPRESVLLIGFGGEEHGQKGSAHYLRSLPPGERRAIRAMVNLDCLGVGPLRTWANRSSDDMEMLFHASSAAFGEPVRKETLFHFASDADRFLHAGIPSVTIHSLSGRDLCFINTGDDLPERVDMDAYEAAFRQLADFLVRIDSYRGPLQLADADATLAPAEVGILEAADASGGRGVELLAIAPGSAEARAGLRPGDVLTVFDGHPLNTRADLEGVLLTIASGRRVSLTLRPAPREGRSEAPSQSHRNRKVVLTY